MNWNLNYLFETPTAFEEALNQLSPYIERLASYQGKLNDEQHFVDFLLLSDELSAKFMKVYLYAHLRADLNRKDVNNSNDEMKCMMFGHQLQEAMAFYDPEILAIGEKTILNFVDRNNKIEAHRFGFIKLFRQNAYILDEKSERLLAIHQPLSNKGSDLYGMLSTNDATAIDVTFSDGQVVKVSQGSWRSLITKAPTIDDRKKVFEAIFNYYANHKSTYAGIYSAVLEAGKASTKARGYDNILESYLHGNNIPTAVFHNLIEVASNHNEAVKKYYAIRQQVLGLEAHRSYDRFLELASSDKEYSYEEAKEMFFASIEHLPEDFKANAYDSLKEGFVDVFEQDGKRSGAYSSSVPNLHPYILLNYSKTLDDVFTVAHEAGHSMHSLFSMQTQPSPIQGYTIFVAEIASTFNEHVLLDYLIKSGKMAKNEKIMLLQKAIDEIMGTFYRQTLFAEYEYRAHQLVEQNQPINHEILSNIMVELYQKYYGLNIAEEEVKQYVWAYIPHLFYTPFYVYQYATSFAASFKIYKDVKEAVPGAFDRYINLLKSGGSKFPIEQAKEAGVDFLNKQTFMAVVERLEELVAELEKVIND